MGRHPRLGRVPAPEVRRGRVVRGVRVAEAAGRACGRRADERAVAAASRRARAAAGAHGEDGGRACGAVPLLPLAPAVPAGVREGGFDVVLGNPPWERVKLQEQEFFAARSDEIANAPNAAARKKLIAALAEDGSELCGPSGAPRSRKPKAKATSFGQSGRYPLCGKGTSTPTRSSPSTTDHAGPDAGARLHRARPGSPPTTRPRTTSSVLVRRAEACVSSIASRTRSSSSRTSITRQVLSLLDTCGADRAGSERSRVLRHGGRSADDASRVYFSSRAEDFALLNPNTRTCPTFRSRATPTSTSAMYRRAGSCGARATRRRQPLGPALHAHVPHGERLGLFQHARGA